MLLDAVNLHVESYFMRIIVRRIIHSTQIYMKDWFLNYIFMINFLNIYISPIISWISYSSFSNHSRICFRNAFSFGNSIFPRTFRNLTDFEIVKYLTVTVKTIYASTRQKFNLGMVKYYKTSVKITYGIGKVKFNIRGSRMKCMFKNIQK